MQVNETYLYVKGKELSFLLHEQTGTLLLSKKADNLVQEIRKQF